MEDRRVVGRENDLLVVLFCKRGELLQQSDAQLGVEGGIDVVDREEGWCVRADEEREVEKEEQESLVRAPLVEEGVFWEEVIPNSDAALAGTEILGDVETLKPIDQRQPLLDLYQALISLHRV